MKPLTEEQIKKIKAFVISWDTWDQYNKLLVPNRFRIEFFEFLDRHIEDFMVETMPYKHTPQLRPIETEVHERFHKENRESTTTTSTIDSTADITEMAVGIDENGMHVLTPTVTKSNTNEYPNYKTMKNIEDRVVQFDADDARALMPGEIKLIVDKIKLSASDHNNHIVHHFSDIALIQHFLSRGFNVIESDYGRHIISWKL